VNCYILRYAEIGLKSDQTRRRWLNVLKENVQRGLFRNDVEYSALKIVQGRLILYTEDEGAEEVLSKAFGVVSFSPAREIRAELEDIRKAALELYDECGRGTFRVSSQRITKDFEMTSMELNCHIGDAICGLGGVVDLVDYETNIGIEIIWENAYLFHRSLPGPGGLPYGVQGEGCAIIRDYRDFLSCLLFMKRGCKVDLLVLRSPMACNYIDLLQSYAFGGLKTLLIDDEWQLEKAMERYIKEGIEVFVSGDAIEPPADGVDLCPTELYSSQMAEQALRMCNIYSLPAPIDNYRISAGCVVYYKGTVLLLRRKDEKTWVLPKGGVDSMELFPEAASREVCEESGVCSLQVSEYIGKTRYSASDREGPFTKDVYYFIGHAKNNKVALEYIFDSYTFLPAPEAHELLSFENDRRILRGSEKILKHIK